MHKRDRKIDRKRERDNKDKTETDKSGDSNSNRQRQKRRYIKTATETTIRNAASCLYTLSRRSSAFNPSVLIIIIIIINSLFEYEIIMQLLRTYIR